MAQELPFKVVLLGEGAVGKTSLTLRYVQGQFNEKHLSTVQASFFTKRVQIGNKRVKLGIWDTAGQERYAALGPIYYRDAHGALLVYDITDRQSFERVKSWVKELKKMKSGPCVIVIAGNKIDLERSRTVEESEAKEYAKSVGAEHYYTSAKLGKGLEEVFVQGLTRRMLEQFPNGGAGGAKRTVNIANAGPGVDVNAAFEDDSTCKC